jgi:gamma-glutamylputrescine oxidase
MQLSYWERDSFFKDIDVTIIGSGIVGLNAALTLKTKHPKLNILILERGILPYGASTRNAGFACFGSVSELLDDLSKHSEDEVFNLVERRWKGLDRLRRNLSDSAIDYLNYGGYELFNPDDEAIYQKCAEQIDYINKKTFEAIGVASVYKNADEKIKQFGFNKTSHLIACTAEAQIDTGKMMKALLHRVQNLGVIIINGISVTRWEEKSDGIELCTNQNVNFKTNKLLAATNAFAKQLLPENLSSIINNLIVNNLHELNIA